MRAVSTPALGTFLAAQSAAKDTPLLMADCYTFTLRSGTVLTYTNADVPVILGGVTFVANGVLVDGLTFNCKAGLDVDQQEVTIAARSVDTVGGVPVLIALRRGTFDGCLVQRERAFLSSWGAPAIGSIVLFKGRMASIDEIGRTRARVTVASDLVLLNIDLPRNFYQTHCVHTLYDSGCGLTKAAFGTDGTVGVAPSTTMIPWAGAAAVHTQGTILFTSGINAGMQPTIKSVVAGTSLILNYPLDAVPAAGDAFTAYQGCDHRLSTCQTQFANSTNFRGFPYIPPPTSAF